LRDSLIFISGFYRTQLFEGLKLEVRSRCKFSHRDRYSRAAWGRQTRRFVVCCFFRSFRWQVRTFL